MNWQVGILTAPRQKPTLAKCMASLTAAGWPSPRVYAEPDSDLEGALNCVVHSKRLGVGSNWVFALSDCLERRPDAVLIMQDDAILATRCREYVELSWPAEADVLWLYRGGRATPPEDAGRGWLQTNPHTETVYGSLAVAMRADAAAQLLERQADRLRKIAVGFDVHLQLRLVDKMHMAVFQHYPSLVQHIGRHSILHPGMFLSKSRRAADDWIQHCGDLIDAMGSGGDDGPRSQVGDVAWHNREP